jgi:hypothetical protein
MPLIICPDCENRISDAAPKCLHCGRPAQRPFVERLLENTPEHFRRMKSEVAGDSDNLIRRIAEYYHISAILWLILAIFQILSIFGIVAGIWNLFACASRFRMVKHVRNRDPFVLEAHEDTGQLIVLGAINFLLGGVVGVAFVGFDFFIRDKVLSNAHLFEGSSAP